MGLANIERFSKEKSYIDLTVEAYEEYFETPFSGWGSPIFIVVQQKERQTKIRWL